MRRAPHWQWATDDIATLHARRYRLRRSAFEIALRPGARCALGEDSSGGGGYCMGAPRLASLAHVTSLKKIEVNLR